jgi:hypothetical protein
MSYASNGNRIRHFKLAIAQIGPSRPNDKSKIIRDVKMLAAEGWNKRRLAVRNYGIRTEVRWGYPGIRLEYLFLTVWQLSDP